MTVPASRSKRVEDASTLIFVLAVVTSLWRPELRWPVPVALVVLLLVAVGLRFIDTDADRERRRKSARKGEWLVPAVTLAFAVQIVYFAAPEERTRSLLLGAALVAAGFGIFWKRRSAV